MLFRSTYDPEVPADLVYAGRHLVTDRIPDAPVDAGKLVLSPTRTYAPLIKLLLQHFFSDLHGIIHCSGGGQTKCLKYLPRPYRLIKDRLFDAPIVFQLIRQASGADLKEMYQVFNMGHRLEVFTSDKAADEMIACAASLGIEARRIGWVEPGGQKELLLRSERGELRYLADK